MKTLGELLYDVLGGKGWRDLSEGKRLRYETKAKALERQFAAYRGCHPAGQGDE